MTDMRVVSLLTDNGAHNNPLTDDDIESVKVRFREWTNQVKDVEGIIGQ